MNRHARAQRLIRERLGLNREQMARRLGYYSSSVKRWEEGNHAPRPAALHCYAVLAEEAGLPSLATVLRGAR